MSQRTVALLNFFGAVTLAVLLVLHWRNERMLEQQLARKNTELVEQNVRHSELVAHCAALERDVSQLKSALEATRAEAAAVRETNRRQLDQTVADSTQKLTEWEIAVAGRDKRISELDAELKAARSRLDEAITQLKAAGAR
jgi:septal ring factor EnvC (AmiA/AmiB activator)